MTKSRQWQPIETAPRDGTVILAYASTGEMVTVAAATWSQDRLVWELLDTGSYADDSDCSLDLTHWMPLPDPPH